MMRAQIIGTGSCLPEQTASNHFLSTLVDTSDEWIQSRTGIRQRHIVSAEEENTVSMGWKRLAGPFRTQRWSRKKSI